jgi:hypothetical protein
MLSNKDPMPSDKDPVCAARRACALRAVGVAGLLALAPFVAACGGSSGGKIAASASVGSSAAKVSVSTSPLPSLSGSAGPLHVGQNVTLTGTVDKVLIPGGFLFSMTANGQSEDVLVGTISGAQAKEGDAVTVTGTVASVNVTQLTQQFGSQLTPQAKQQLQKFNGSNIVNASNVQLGGASASASVSMSASG